MISRRSVENGLAAAARAQQRAERFEDSHPPRRSRRGHHADCPLWADTDRRRCRICRAIDLGNIPAVSRTYDPSGTQERLCVRVAAEELSTVDTRARNDHLGGPKTRTAPAEPQVTGMLTACRRCYRPHEAPPDTLCDRCEPDPTVEPR